MTKLRIGFFPTATSSWIGGVNYYTSLFDSLATHAPALVECIALVPYDCPAEIVSRYARSATVVPLRLLARDSFSGVVFRVLKRLGLASTKNYLKRFQLDLVSHLGEFEELGLPSIAWIPDFQHWALPKLFPTSNRKALDEQFRGRLLGCTLTILSSRASASDADAFMGVELSTTRVLPFAPVVADCHDSDLQVAKVRDCYSLPERYFHLPNQFWEHKNHLDVFQALSILRQQGRELHLVCTGNLEDYRNPNHVPTLMDSIHTPNLDPYVHKNFGETFRTFSDMRAVMLGSHAVINPSLFEGWSTTVEESIALHKRLILSSIPVHHEQAGDSAEYFAPGHPDQLAEVLWKVWNKQEVEVVEYPVRDHEREAFGLRYLSIVREAIEIHQKKYKTKGVRSHGRK